MNYCFLRHTIWLLFLHEDVAFVVVLVFYRFSQVEETSFFFHIQVVYISYDDLWELSSIGSH